jgi:hypothetical protein
MTIDKDDNLDKLFKNGLEDPLNEPAFREADWASMEQALRKQNKRAAVVYWLPALGSAAAIILLILGWLFLKPVVVKPGKNEQVAVKRHNGPGSDSTNLVKNNTGTSGGPNRQAADSNMQQAQTTAKNAITPPANGGQKSNSFFTLSSGKGRRNDTGQNDRSGQPGAEAVVAAGVNQGQLPDTLDHRAAIAKNINPGKTVLGTADDKTILGTADGKTVLGTADEKKENDKGQMTLQVAPVTKKGPGAQNSGFRPQYAISVLASADLNGVNSAFQQSQVGGNFGALFSMNFAPKWTVTTGAMYDVKPYLTNFSNYHTNYQFKETPTSVNANCRMLDIPINVSYQVYKQQANKISIGTGLSSYFMLREDYQFNYSDPYQTGPAHYTVINKNHNILSVLNLETTYTRQVNPKMGVSIQPYMKVPLSDVGASQVRLRSAGIALGFSWNINAVSKPK